MYIARVTCLQFNGSGGIVCVSLAARGVSDVAYAPVKRGGGLGSRPKKMYGERLGNGVEYHLMSPTPRR